MHTHTHKHTHSHTHAQTHTGTLVFAEEQAAAACQVAKNKNLVTMDLRQACRKSQLSGGVLVIVAPKIADVALCDQLVQVGSRHESAGIEQLYNSRNW